MSRRGTKKKRRATKPGKRPGAKRGGDRLLDRALKLHHAGKLDEALALYRQLLARQPNDIDALMNLGHVYTSKGVRSKARQCYRKALRLQPSHPQMLRDCGNGLNHFALWSEATTAYRRAIACDPQYAEAYADLGRLLLETGHPDSAIGMLGKATFLKPQLAVAHYELHRAVFDENNLQPAIDCLRRAVLADPAFVAARFYLGMLLEQAGQEREGREILKNLHADQRVWAGAVDSWEYVQRKRTKGTRLLPTTRDTLVHALQRSPSAGLVLEFGVRFGASFGVIAEHADQAIHGFDSFEGLPQEWHARDAGAYTTHGELPDLPPRAQLHIGLFQETLPAFVARHDGPLRFANIDCDLYASTATIFEHLAPRVVAGTVLVFDEYLMNDRWREDEFKAFQEAAGQHGWRYRYLAFSLQTSQAAVQIIGT